MIVRPDLRDLNDEAFINTYLFGFDIANRVDSERYRCYVILISLIRELLEECMINTGCKGYMYMQDCIITIFDQRTMNIRFNKDVYPYVACKYGVKNPANIEHSIRNALVAAYKLNAAEEHRRSEILSAFGRRPTNKEFLLYLAREVYDRLLNESVEFARY